MTSVIESALLFDERVKCYSLMSAVKAMDYLALVESAYAKRGGLKHQRDALKTTTARRIRARMVSDIKRGAILPPVVIGVIVDPALLNKIPEMDPAETVRFISRESSRYDFDYRRYAAHHCASRRDKKRTRALLRTCRFA